ncbi:hypothetical protein XF35_25450 [Streptomyces platensis subsp. clarensis]|nr:hypothetical protein [Streptomyces platensis subsp. clarensis]
MAVLLSVVVRVELAVGAEGSLRFASLDAYQARDDDRGNRHCSRHQQHRPPAFQPLPWSSCVPPCSSPLGSRSIR